MAKRKTIDVKVKEKTIAIDEMFNMVKEKVTSSDKFKNDPVVHSLIREFERTSIINDNLWGIIETNGYTVTNIRNEVKINQALTAYNKNQTVMCKLGEQLATYLDKIGIDNETEW